MYIVAIPWSMKESDFIKQNKEKWLEFEKNLEENKEDPSKTSKLFIQITDDLSYARTFYPNRSVRLYLNGIAKLLFNDLNKSEKRRWAGFIDFWKRDLPLTVFRARRPMLISFVVFVICFVLGVVTSIHDKNFARKILSNDYVNMTNENIAKGDPMAVYNSRGELETFLPILLNNMRVDFLTFFSGIFMAIGSLVVMVINGVMVGVFQYFFIEKGLFWPSFLSIWTHGALEISAIILSGGAGLRLGGGLLFPGTYTRFQAFKISGMDGLKIIMGVAPVTLVAAFIEGFLTRHTNIPDLLRFLFILLSFAFIILYFFYYPRRVAKQQAVSSEGSAHTLVYKPEQPFDPSAILSGGHLLTETFRLFFTHFALFGRYIFGGAIVCAILVAINPVQMLREDERMNFYLKDMFNFPDYPLMGALILCTLLLSGTAFLRRIRRIFLPALAEEEILSAGAIKSLLTMMICFLVFELTIFSDLDFTMLAANLLFPLFVFIGCVSFYNNMHVTDALNYGWRLLKHSWSKFFLCAVSFSILSYVVLSTVVYGLNLLFINDALSWMLTNDETTAAQIHLGFMAFNNLFSYFLYFALTLISGSLLYFTLKETDSAEHLIARIKKISALK